MQNTVTLNVDGVNVPVGPYYINLMQQWQKIYVQEVDSFDSEQLDRMLSQLHTEMSAEYVAKYKQFGINMEDLDFALMDHLDNPNPVTNKIPALDTLLNYIANNNLTEMECKLIESSLQNLNRYSLQLHLNK